MKQRIYPLGEIICPDEEANHDGTGRAGKQIVVFHRSTRGKWEAVAASFNSDLPRPVTTEAVEAEK